MEDRKFFDIPQADLVEFYSKLVPLATNVHRLILRGVEDLNSDQISSFATSLLSLTQLEHLELGQVRPSSIIVDLLSRLPNLKKVVLTSYPYFSRAQPGLSFKERPEKQAVFPSLESLSAALHVASGTAAMLIAIRDSHSLKELTISDADSHQPGNAAERDLPKLCDAIARHDDLRLLHLRRLSDTIAMNKIFSILQCSLLENLIIEANPGILLQDEDILDLAMALPLLQTIKIAATVPVVKNMGTSTLSLQSIIWLLAECPSLSSIEMIVDATGDIPDVDDVEVADIEGRESLKLIIGYSPIDRDSVEEVADFLDALPVLRVIQIEPRPWTPSDHHSDSEESDSGGRCTCYQYEENEDVGLSMWEEVQSILEGEESHSWGY